MWLCLAKAEEHAELLREIENPASKVSFYNLRHKSDEQIEQILTLLKWGGERCFVFCDSGGYEWYQEWLKGLPNNRRVNAHKYVMQEMGDKIGAYLDEYLAFLHKFRDRLDAFTELDVGTAEDKKALRRRFLEQDLFPVPVYHNTDKFSYCLDLFEEFPFVCLGTVANVPEDEIRKVAGRIFNRAKEYGTKLHGLGMTNPELLKKYPWFSVDSTRWLNWALYGELFWFTLHDGLCQYAGQRRAKESGQPPVRVAVYKHGKALRAAGLDVSKLLAEDSDECMRMNAIAWRDLGIVMNRYHEKRAKKREEAAEKRQAEVALSGQDRIENNALQDTERELMPKKEVSEETRQALREAHEGQLNVVTGLRHGPVKRIPSLRCDNCYITEECPESEEGALCKFEPTFNALAVKLDTRDAQAIEDYLVEKIQMDSRRYHRNIVYELVTGGSLDKAITGLSQNLSRDVKLLAELLGVRQPTGGRGPVTVYDQRQQLIVQSLEQLQSGDRARILEVIADLGDQQREPRRLEAGAGSDSPTD